MEFKGRLKVAGDTGEGIPVALRLDDIYLELWAEGEELGIWRLDTVTVERRAGNEFSLDLDDEPMVFVAADPLGFAYEGLSYVEQIGAKFKKKRRGKRREELPLLRGARLGRSDEPTPQPAAGETSRVVEPLVPHPAPGGFAARMAEAIDRSVEETTPARGIGAFFDPGSPDGAVASPAQPAVVAPTTPTTGPGAEPSWSVGQPSATPIQPPASDDDQASSETETIEIPVHVDDLPGSLRVADPVSEITIEAQPSPAFVPPAETSPPAPPVGRAISDLSVPPPSSPVEPPVMVVEEVAAYSFGLDAIVEVVPVTSPGPGLVPAASIQPAEPVPEEPPADKPIALVEESPVEESPVEEVPVARVEESPVEEVPVEESPVEEVPVARVEESPVEVVPVEESPVEVVPVARVEESPVEEPVPAYQRSWFVQSTPPPRPVSLDDSSVDQDVSWFVAPVDPYAAEWERARRLRQGEDSVRRERFVAPEPLVESNGKMDAEHAEPGVDRGQAAPTTQESEPIPPPPPAVEAPVPVPSLPLDVAVPEAESDDVPEIVPDLSATVSQAVSLAPVDSVVTRFAPPAPETRVEPPRGRHADSGRRARRPRRIRENHQHTYDTARTVGGLTRRVCTECGHVSFDSEDVYQGWA